MEVVATNQSTTEEETTTTPNVQSSTVSDIASFDAIKAKDE